MIAGHVLAPNEPRFLELLAILGGRQHTDRSADRQTERGSNPAERSNQQLVTRERVKPARLARE